jgi:uncharacterized membrane protein YdjX (TVP38/TMEM64 family)
MTQKTDKSQEKSLGQTLHEMSSRPMPRGLVIALLIALGISIISITLVEIFDGAAKMRAWIEGAGAWAPLAFVGLKAATYVVAPLSGTPVKLAGGALFGFWEGAALGLTGDMLGASMNFWIARLFRDRGIKQLAGKKAIKQIDELTEHVGGWKALLAARLFLSSLYDFISYAAGISSLPFKHFFWVSLFAGIPSTLFAAWIGDAAVTNKPFLYIMFAVSAAGLLALLFMHKRQSGK